MPDASARLGQVAVVFRCTVIEGLCCQVKALQEEVSRLSSKQANEQEINGLQ